MVADLRDTGWFKSSRSGANDEGCVEVRLTDRVVGLRDSKDPAGHSFDLTPGEWRSFVAATKSDRFNPR